MVVKITKPTYMTNTGKLFAKPYYAAHVELWDQLTVILDDEIEHTKGGMKSHDVLNWMSSNRNMVIEFLNSIELMNKESLE